MTVVFVGFVGRRSSSSVVGRLQIVIMCIYICVNSTVPLLPRKSSLERFASSSVSISSRHTPTPTGRRTSDMSVFSKKLGKSRSSKTPSPNARSKPTSETTKPSDDDSMTTVVKKPTNASSSSPAPGASVTLGDAMTLGAFGVVANKAVPGLEKAAPAIKRAAQLAKASEPYASACVRACGRAWTALEPYHPKEFAPALIGFFLCFFGGYFATLTAAVEAYRITGWTSTKEALVVVWRNVERAQEASAKDDELDEDGNGIPDTQEITTKELVVRKIGVVAKAVDPEQVGEALSAVYMGFVAVTATLRVHFAACVSLGVAVGDILNNIVDENLTPVLMMSTPKEYQKWVGPGVRYGCKVIGVVAAWMVQQAITAYHSATRGAQLFARGLLTYLVRHGYLGSNAIDEKGSVFNFAIFVLAMTGFYSQIMYGFRLPFPLNLVLIPVRLVEFALRVAVGAVGDSASAR